MGLAEVLESLRGIIRTYSVSVCAEQADLVAHEPPPLEWPCRQCAQPTGFFGCPGPAGRQFIARWDTIDAKEDCERAGRP